MAGVGGPTPHTRPVELGPAGPAKPRAGGRPPRLPGSAGRHTRGRGSGRNFACCWAGRRAGQPLKPRRIAAVRRAAGGPPPAPVRHRGAHTPFQAHARPNHPRIPASYLAQAARAVSVARARRGWPTGRWRCPERATGFRDGKLFALRNAFLRPHSPSVRPQGAVAALTAWRAGRATRGLASGPQAWATAAPAVSGVRPTAGDSDSSRAAADPGQLCDPAAEVRAAAIAAVGAGGGGRGGGGGQNWLVDGGRSNLGQAKPQPRIGRAELGCGMGWQAALRSVGPG